MFDVLLDITGVIIDSLRRARTVRAWLTGISALLLAVVLVLWAAAPLLFSGELVLTVREVVRGFALGFAFLLILALASFTGVKIAGGGSVKLELESLLQERQRIEARLAETPKPDVLDTIQLSLNQLAEYYTINKSQARNSFRFSVFAVVVGLATLIAGVWLFYLKENPNVQLTAITGIAGALVQFIGGAYFYLYRRSLEQLNFFFVQLVRMQDTMLSVRLCDQIAPEAKQVELREKVILALLQRSSDLALNVGTRKAA